MPNPFRCAKECEHQAENYHVLLQNQLEGAIEKTDPGHEDFPKDRLVESAWQGWLLEWEEKLRLQLEHHQNAMQKLVEAMCKELMQNPGKQVRKANAGAAGVKAARFADLEVEVGQEDSSPDSDKVRALPSSPDTQLVGRNRSKQSCVSHRASYKKDHGGANTAHMNAAMVSATGGEKQNKDAKLTMSGMSRSKDVLVSRSIQSLETTLQTISVMLSEKASHASRGVIRRFLLRMVQHRCFHLLSTALIAAYTAAVGIMADQQMRSAVADTDAPRWNWYIDLVFTAIFAAEVVLRVLGEGVIFFIGREWKWNVFDCSVAFVGLLDVVSVFDVNLGVLRVLRTLRAVRVLRVIRVFPVFKQLRVMIASILACLVSLLWAFLLLSAVVYIFAVILMQGASEFLRTSDVPDALRKVLEADFGSLTRTIYSLTQACSGGRSWGEYAEPFIQISPWYGVGFTLFMLFVIFGIMNILTGLFVENTCALAKIDKELVIQEAMAQQQSVVNQIRQLFRELDVDGSGTLTYSELHTNLNDDRVKTYFSLLDLDVSEAEGLFQLLDRDESGEVSSEEFIVSCMRLKGAAKAIDLAAMLFENKRLYTMMKSFMQSIDELMVDLKEKVELLSLS